MEGKRTGLNVIVVFFSLFTDRLPHGGFQNRPDGLLRRAARDKGGGEG